jgi:hypothetical protein
MGLGLIDCPFVSAAGKGVNWVLSVEDKSRSGLLPTLNE